MADRKKRRDHRSGTELRAIDISLNYLRRADGSARLSQGDTTVICAVYGPIACNRRNQELIDRSFLEVIFKSANDRPGQAEKEMQAVLEKTFDAAIISSKYPRTLLRLVVQVVKDDGSLLAAAINAGFLALLDAGYPMKMSLVAVSCCLTPIEGEGKRQLFLDPIAEEEKKEHTTNICVTFRADNKAVIASLSTGVCSDDDFFESCEQLSRASAYILAVTRKSIEHRYASAKQQMPDIKKT